MSNETKPAEQEKDAPQQTATCEDCRGASGTACHDCGKVVCRPCAEREGAFCRCAPRYFTQDDTVREWDDGGPGSMIVCECYGNRERYAMAEKIAALLNASEARHG